MMPDELILGVSSGGTRAPIRSASSSAHGVSNDTINGIPVALAYCRPCGSAVLYRTDTPKGTLTLALSGRSREADRSSSTARPARSGGSSPALRWKVPWRGSGIELQPLPVVLTTWKSWFESHLETRVLSLETGASRSTSRSGRRRSGVLPTVFGLVLGGAARAYPVDLVAKQGVINDELGGRPVVIVAEPGPIPRNRTVRAFERGDRTFARSGHAFLGADFVNDQNGRPWKIDEESLDAPDGGSSPASPAGSPRGRLGRGVSAGGGYGDGDHGRHGHHGHTDKKPRPAVFSVRDVRASV